MPFRATFRLLILPLLACLTPREEIVAIPPMEITAVAPRAEHAVIISVDGLRPDAISAAGATNLMGLIRQGAWCPTASTIQLSRTLPSHTSMLTGLDLHHHGVRHNGYTPGSISSPTVFTACKKAGKSTAMYISKEKLRYLAVPGSVDFLYGPDPWDQPNSRTWSAMEIAGIFRETWRPAGYAMSFIHLREPDGAGHTYGWMSPPYLEAVREIDAAIGDMVRTIRESGRMDRTVLIISADHGGHDLDHGGPSSEDTTIPWICVGPGVPRGLIIHRSIATFDTAPTALLFLGLSPSNLDGKAVPEVFPD